MSENKFDAGVNTDQDSINIVRNKTFNPEFRDLVNRVIGREPGSGEDVVDFAKIDDMPEEELLKRLYQLHYLSKSLLNNRETNVSFKPFELEKDLVFSDNSDATSEYFRAQFQKTAYPFFAILSYRRPMKGYIPLIHNLECYDTENIVLSLRSGLFKKIFDTPEGLIIRSDTIADDFFLTKLFQTKNGPHKSLYFVMLSSVTEELEKELCSPGVNVIPPFLPSAICMVEIEEAEAHQDVSRITNVLRKRLSLPFLLLSNRLSRDYSLTNFRGLTNAFHLLDYFFSVFIIRGEGVGVNIRFSGPRGPAASFLMKYIISKLNHMLSSDSAIVHFFKNQVLVFTKSSSIDAIAAIVDSHNSLFDEKLSMLKFYAKDYDDSIQMIQDLILDN